MTAGRVCRRLRRTVEVLAALGVAWAAPAAAHAASTVAWRPCFEAPLQCATAHVPLDYQRPGGEQIAIALARLPAADPQRRIGSLFINPGGPGGSGVDFVRFAGPDLISPQVRERFDIVGFDPRGVASSTPLRCFESQEASFAALPEWPFPQNAVQLAQFKAADHTLVSACRQAGGAIRSHMSTANVARDMDRLRAAVGDDRLSYYGVSYGSYLGVTYANLFPNRVRALVVDGVLNPVLWATGRGGDGTRIPFSARLGSDLGAGQTLREFLRLCAAGGPRHCALAPDPRRRYFHLIARLRRHPVRIVFPDGSVVDENDSRLIGDTLGALYDSAGWSDFAQFLAFLEANASARRMGSAYQRLEVGRPAYWIRLPTHDYVNVVESFPAVACEDTLNPDSYDAWLRAGATRRTIFTPVWTWASSPCAVWPFEDTGRYLGPFDARTANPVLVVGNLFDPATPYAGAQAVARLMPRARLLTLHGWGHTSLFRSACVDAALTRYLVDRQLPAPHTVCQQDFTPFADG
jgi:pimeloyl-ACP methyl ester carboxylesterase